MSFGAADTLLVEPEPTVESLDLAGGEIRARTPWQVFWRRFRQDRVALVSGAFVVFLIIVAIFAPVIVSVLGLPGPNVNNSNALDVFGSPTGPSLAHPLGVDQLGRDVLSRIIYGTRVSLTVGIVGTGISAIIGTVIGLLAGFYRGWIDTLLMRAVDVFLSFPVLVLGLGIAAACGVRGCLSGVIQPGIATVIFIIAITSFTYIARIVRGQVLSLREKEFIESARSLGASNSRILFREMLPNVMAPLIVYSSLLIPINILFEAYLSFLGVGVRQPTASWGQMLSDAGNFILGGTNAWWYMLFPGLALLFTVLAFNLMGDGLLDALNPRGERTR